MQSHKPGCTGCTEGTCPTNYPHCHCPNRQPRQLQPLRTNFEDPDAITSAPRRVEEPFPPAAWAERRAERGVSFAPVVEVIEAVVKGKEKEMMSLEEPVSTSVVGGHGLEKAEVSQPAPTVTASSSTSRMTKRTADAPESLRHGRTKITKAAEGAAAHAAADITPVASSFRDEGTRWPRWLSRRRRSKGPQRPERGSVEMTDIKGKQVVEDKEGGNSKTISAVVGPEDEDPTPGDRTGNTEKARERWIHRITRRLFARKARRNSPRA